MIVSKCTCTVSVQLSPVQNKWQFVRVSPQPIILHQWHMLVHGGVADKPATIPPNCLGLLCRSMDLWAKMNQDVRLASKNSQRLTTTSRLISDLNMLWPGRSARMHTGIWTLTRLWAHYGNAIHHTVSECPCSQPCMGLASHTAPLLKPRWLWGPERAHMLCVCTLRIHRDHTRHSVTTHLCLLVEAGATQRDCVG